METETVCRLCLAQLPVSYSLLEDGGAEMVESLTSIKIEEHDGLPKCACAKCWLNIKLAYKIQQNILEVDRKLRCIDPFETPINDTAPELKVTLEEINPDMKSDNLKDLEDINLNSYEHENTIKVENLTDTEFAILVVKDAYEGKTEVEKSVCHICGISVQENMMPNHIKEHYFSKQYCDDCNKVFEDIQSYRSHVLSKHKELQQIWTCEQCLGTFQYKTLYKIHTDMAHINGTSEAKKITYLQKKLGIRSVHALRAFVTPNKSMKYECDQCSRVYDTDAQRRAHVRAFHHVKKCPICDKLISSANFKKHVFCHTAKSVVCHICGSNCKNEESLRSHIHYTHSTKKFPCDHCGKIFTKSYSRLLHVKKEHTGERNHICDECGKSFITLFTLNSHIRMTHQQLRLHECQYCKKKFSSKYAMKTHERQHTNEAPYKCVHCGECFRQRVSLRSHLKSKHNIQEKLVCPCKVCGKMFANEHALTTHVTRLHV